MALDAHSDMFEAADFSSHGMLAGVVGNTPVLKPYDCFQYYSFASLESMQGAMYGTFQMLGYKDHEFFDAQIPPFKLIAPK